jgi:hypothetical protein
MAAVETLHAGDVILGHDGNEWGVEAVMPGPPPGLILVRYGQKVTGYPPAGTEYHVISRADVNAEMIAAEQLINAGLGPLEIVWEKWDVE